MPLANPLPRGSVPAGRRTACQPARGLRGRAPRPPCMRSIRRQWVCSRLLPGPLHQRSFLLRRRPKSPSLLGGPRPGASVPLQVCRSRRGPTRMELLGFRAQSPAGPRAEGAPVPDGASLACLPLAARGLACQLRPAPRHQREGLPVPC